MTDTTTPMRSSPPERDQQYNPDHDLLTTPESRAEARERALKAIGACRPGELEDLVEYGEPYLIADLITDLLHLGDQYGLAADELIAVAKRHYEAEWGRPDDGQVAQRKAGPMNCSRCGRFVWGEDCGLAWDAYCGGWEADPLCKRCQGGADA